MEIKGTLTFFTETGTEGGFWALQDENYMGYKIPDQCYSGQEVSNTDLTRTGRVWEVLLRDSITVEWYDGIEEGSYVKREDLLIKQWFYEGLHILADGDQLIIYDLDEPEKSVWEGIIQLVHFPLFTEAVFGWWIHSEQQGVSRKSWANWFMDGYPARLTPSVFTQG